MRSVLPVNKHPGSHGEYLGSPGSIYWLEVLHVCIHLLIVHSKLRWTEFSFSVRNHMIQLPSYIALHRTPWKTNFSKLSNKKQVSELNICTSSKKHNYRRNTLQYKSLPEALIKTKFKKPLIFIHSIKEDRHFKLLSFIMAFLFTGEKLDTHNT